jgi:hypothetical protein
LGELALPDFCERCFWIQLRCGWRMPFTFFPGIFSTLDSHVKHITAAHFAGRGHLPPWLPADLGAPIAVPHWSKFAWRDAATNTLLVGAPDEMTRCRDGNIAVVDYKTAKYTDAADALLPLYHVQLNCYAHIAQKLGVGRASSLWLVYCEPQSIDSDDPLALCLDDGFSMRFGIKLVPVRIETDLITPLLVRARRIANLTEAPNGRDGCTDCERLGKVLSLITEVRK